MSKVSLQYVLWQDTWLEKKRLGGINNSTTPTPSTTTKRQNFQPLYLETDDAISPSRA